MVSTDADAVGPGHFTRLRLRTSPASGLRTLGCRGETTPERAVGASAGQK